MGCEKRYVLIDQGNSAIKCQYWSGGVLRESFRSLNGDLSALVDFCTEHEALPVYIASVAKEADYASVLVILENGWADLNGSKCGAKSGEVYRIETEREAFGVTHTYEDYRQHGVDRWLALLAAYAEKRAPVAVIDCGTAVTVDVVQSEDNTCDVAQAYYHGGYIVASESMMVEMLQQKTGHIRYNGQDEQRGLLVDNAVLGRTTEACVVAGAHVMVRSFLRSLVEAFHADGINVVVTGGGAVKYAEIWSTFAVNIVPDMVVRGLRLYAEGMQESGQSVNVPVKEDGVCD